MGKPILLFGYGNLSRGDDALGPLLLEYAERSLNLDRIEILSDFQLQVEHALDLEGRERVLFVDAAVNQGKPFVFSRLHPERDLSYTTHAMSPSAVLQVYRTIRGEIPPPSFLLSIAGTHFELGEALSEKAAANLTDACRFIEYLLLEEGGVDDWERLAEQGQTIAA
ncbi:hydrogenase maturation protease [Methylomarinum vadi]|uniref:hydrogenase maturation protease n=1 Tax=Methylomarinum vadi TaxID=438855 RepID=UPI0004DF2EAC|nr:hydrogenase maturation protease [Methylomarinum vadi]